MTAAKIIEDLSLNSKGRYTISPLDFSKIEVALCESRSRFTYNASDGTLQFIKPTWIHACSSIWLKNWVYEWSILKWLIHIPSVFLPMQIYRGLQAALLGGEFELFTYFVIIYLTSEIVRRTQLLHCT